jgi:hypothetical protein
MSIREAMQKTERAILIYHPENGWACTNIEGAEFNQLLWCEEAEEAVSAMTGNCVLPSAEEQAVTDVVVAQNKYWAAEWAPALAQDGWNRPFIFETTTEHLPSP